LINQAHFQDRNQLYSIKHPSFRFECLHFYYMSDKMKGDIQKNKGAEKPRNNGVSISYENFKERCVDMV